MDRIKALYDPNNFQELGHQLIAFLTQHLEDAVGEQKKVLDFQSPELALASWKKFMDSDAGLLDFYKKVVQDSTILHNPKYLGHQVSVPAPLAAFGGLISDLMNNGMAVYEMGGAANPLERMVIQMMCEAAGFDDNAGGFLTSGGTLANLTAMLTARRVKIEEDIWQNGHQGIRLGIMVSEQAHYCIDRAARIMGLGEEGIIKLPVDDHYRVDTSMLEIKLKEAEEKGIRVFCIVSSSCSTSTGSYDNLATLRSFATKHNLWLHVDGAHGGAVIFSDMYKHLVAGIDTADSIVIDCHKMMMTPTICTAVLYRNGVDSLKTFQQKADYLFDASQDFDWWNSGKRTFECTKLMMSIKVMAIQKFVGSEIFGDIVNRLYSQARIFADLINQHSLFELALKPEANILCFRFICDEMDRVNAKIRESILLEGEYYIVQTRLNGELFLRTTVMNPFTTEEHFSKLLDKIVTLGSQMN